MISIKKERKMAKETMKKGLSKKLKLLFYVTGIGLSCLIFWLLIRWAGGIHNILDNFKLISATTIIFIILLYSIGWFFRALRWKKLLMNTGIKTSIFTSMELIFTGNTLNLVVPAKLGDIARIIGLKDKKESQTAFSVASVFTDRFLDLFTIVVLTLFCLPIIGFQNLSSDIHYIIYISIVLIVAVIIFFAYVIIKKGNLKWIQKLPEKIRFSITNFFVGFALTVKKFPYIEVLSSLSIWILDALVAYFLFIDIVGDNQNFIIILFAIMMGNLTKTIPITPGGIGTYEAVFALILTSVGIAPEVSVSIALIDHLFKNFFTLIFGFASFLHLGINISDLRNYTKTKIVTENNE